MLYLKTTIDTIGGGGGEGWKGGNKASEADTVMQFSNKNIITFEAGSLLRNKKP